MLFLAYTDPKSTTIKTITEFVGAQPFALFKAGIEKQLSDTTQAMGEQK